MPFFPVKAEGRRGDRGGGHGRGGRRVQNGLKNENCLRRIVKITGISLMVCGLLDGVCVNPSYGALSLFFAGLMMNHFGD